MDCSWSRIIVLYTVLIRYSRFIPDELSSLSAGTYVNVDEDKEYPTTVLCSISVRFEVFTAVTMKNVVFWDIKALFVPHRRHITSPLHSPAS
jgi:hypothetical protein